jgi:nucleoside-diphosphate-sugar epimerase
VENFRFFDVRGYAFADPEGAAAEVKAEGLIKSTGRTYRHDYVVFLRAAGDARISVADVRDLADVAVAALKTAQHDNQIYALTGPEALTFTEMAHQLSRVIGRTITFVDVSPGSMRAALADLGFPVWQADGLLEEFAMYRRGEAAGVEPGMRDALGRPPRAFAEFARGYAPLFS